MIPRRVLLLVLALLGSGVTHAVQSPPLNVVELSVAQIHAGPAAKTFTCRALVDAYLARIEAHDTRGAALNAITQINSAALAEADTMDRELAVRERPT